MAFVLLTLAAIALGALYQRCSKMLEFENESAERRRSAEFEAKEAWQRKRKTAHLQELNRSSTFDSEYERPTDAVAHPFGDADVDLDIGPAAGSNHLHDAAVRLNDVAGGVEVVVDSVSVDINEGAAEAAEADSKQPAAVVPPGGGAPSTSEADADAEVEAEVEVDTNFNTKAGGYASHSQRPVTKVDAADVWTQEEQADHQRRKSMFTTGTESGTPNDSDSLERKASYNSGGGVAATNNTTTPPVTVAGAGAADGGGADMSGKQQSMAQGSLSPFSGMMTKIKAGVSHQQLVNLFPGEDGARNAAQNTAILF